MTNAEYKRKQRKDPKYQEKERVRSLDRYYKDPRVQCRFKSRKMKLQKKSCAFCGKGNTEIHHLNYSDPELVLWFCPECHRKIHKEVRKKRTVL